MAFLNETGLSHFKDKLDTAYAAKSHTHNYAGSSSAGGAATSANKLNTNAGSSGQPVYFSNGVPVAATAYSSAMVQGIKVDDTRNDNFAPSSSSLTKSALTADFKYSSKVGTLPWSVGTYGGLLTLMPWSETSGGNGYQLGFWYSSGTNPKLSVRTADLSASSWGSWFKIYTSADKPTAADIGAAASSHTHSYLPLSGGTVTGSLTTNGVIKPIAGQYITHAPGTSGTAGYVIFAQIKVTAGYQNEPIVIEISQRGKAQTSTLYLMYSSSDKTDPSVSYFTYMGASVGAYIYKSATSTWDLYIQKTEGYDDPYVVRYHKTGYDSGLTLSWKSVQASSVPSGAIQATPGGYVQYATQLQNARTISLTGDVTGSASFNGTANVSITATVADSSHNHSASNITSGTLSVARGGTGITANPSMLVNLGSTSAAGVFAASPRPGVTGTLPIANGGTGATSASAARSNLGITPANIGAATSNHTHSYLPLSGGTLTGRLTANGKISTPTSGSSWINGKTVTNAAYCVTTQPDSAGNSYYPFFAAKSGGGHTVNIGCLKDDWGFYGYKSSRTDNGTDWSFIFNAGTGESTATNMITSKGGFTSYGNSVMPKSSNLGAFTTSTSATATNGNSRVIFRGNTNQNQGELLTGWDATNTSFMRMEAIRINGSATYYNTINLKLGPTGAYSYSITSPAAFRNTLGLGNTSGAVPVANGGTGATKIGALNNTMALYNLGLHAGTSAPPSSGTAGMVYIQYS